MHKKKVSNTFLVILAIAAFILGIGFAAIIRLSTDLPSPEEIKNYQPLVSTKILDCKERLICEFFQQRRTPVPLSQIPPMLKDGLILVEDKRFYSHWGVDVIRIFGAAFYNLKAMRKAQGASTITQQLARNMFLTQKKTFARKFKEI
jgi:penicillin-binding protein 1A